MYRTTLLVIGLLGCCLTLAAAANPFHVTPRRSPSTVGTAALPNHYVVQKVLGTSPGYIPHDLAVDGDGYVYVLDILNNKVVKLPPGGGAAVKSWGGVGTSDGKFRHPQSITVDPFGYVYVLDTGRNDIQKFNRQGGFIMRFTSMSPFVENASIAAGPAGTIYVCSGAQVNVHTPTGRRYGWFAHMDSSCGDMTVGSDGVVYILDNAPAGIHMYTPSGAPMSVIAGPLGGAFDADARVAASATRVAVLTHDSDARAISLYQKTGALVSQMAAFGGRDGEAVDGSGLAMNAAGALYLSDQSLGRVQKLNAAGDMLRKWGYAGTGNGQFRGPTDVVADQDGNLYVTDALNYRVQRFSPTGVYQNKWGSWGTGNNQFKLPMGITLSSANKLYVVDQRLNRVQRFHTNGTYETQFGGTGTGNAQFREPTDVASAADRIWVLDDHNGYAKAFTLAGAFSSKFLLEDRSNGITGGSTSLFITEGGSDYLHKYSTAGVSLGIYAGGGDQYGQLDDPRKVALNNGKAWVVDCGNDRLQQFSSTGEIQNAISLPSRPITGSLMGLAISGGKIIVTDTLYQKVYILAPVVTPATAGPVAVSGLSATPGAGAASVVFSLSAPAAVQIEICNLAGRVVRQLALEGQAGSNTTLWDCRSSKGLKLPAGAYLVKLTARGAKGEQAGSLTRLALR